MQKHIRNVVAALILIASSAATVLAHDMTFIGTVVELKDKKIQVLVIDEKTKQNSKMTFEVTDKTKVFRGDAEVKFADAHIAKDERIVVTVNHDVSAEKATVVRLAAH